MYCIWQMIWSKWFPTFRMGTLLNPRGIASAVLYQEQNEYWSALLFSLCSWEQRCSQSPSVSEKQIKCWTDVSSLFLFCVTMERGTKTKHHANGPVVIRFGFDLICVVWIRIWNVENLLNRHLRFRSSVLRYYEKSLFWPSRLAVLSTAIAFVL